MRGTYLPPKKEPKEGERKLYLAIEATSELAIQKAKSEVTRLIKEELVRLVGVSGINTSVGVVLQISPNHNFPSWLNVKCVLFTVKDSKSSTLLTENILYLYRSLHDNNSVVLI